MIEFSFSVDYGVILHIGVGTSDDGGGIDVSVDLREDIISNILVQQDIVLA